MSGAHATAALAFCKKARRHQVRSETVAVCDARKQARYKCRDELGTDRHGTIISERGSTDKEELMMRMV